MLSRPTLTSPPVMESLNFQLVDVLRRRRWSAHKPLLCSKSRFFQGALNNPFREAETGVIDLSENDPEAIDHMMNYFYHNDYLVPQTNRPSLVHSRSTSSSSISYSRSSCESSRPMSAMSCSSVSSFNTQDSNSSRRKFNLSMVEDPLLAMAADNLPKPSESPYLSRFGPTSPLALPDSFLSQAKANSEPQPKLDTFIDEGLLGDYYHEESEVPEQEPILESAHLVTHAKVFAIAEQFDIKPLKELARKKYLAQLTYHHDSPQFAQSLSEIYATVETERGLRDAVISSFRRFPELAQRKDVEAAVKEIPDLAWELFRVAWGLPI